MANTAVDCSSSEGTLRRCVERVRGVIQNPLNPVGLKVSGLQGFWSLGFRGFFSSAPRGENTV